MADENKSNDVDAPDDEQTRRSSHCSSSRSHCPFEVLEDLKLRNRVRAFSLKWDKRDDQWRFWADTSDGYTIEGRGISPELAAEDAMDFEDQLKNGKRNQPGFIRDRDWKQTLGRKSS